MLNTTLPRGLIRINSFSVSPLNSLVLLTCHSNPEVAISFHPFLLRTSFAPPPHLLLISLAKWIDFTRVINPDSSPFIYMAVGWCQRHRAGDVDPETGLIPITLNGIGLHSHYTPICMPSSSDAGSSATVSTWLIWPCSVSNLEWFIVSCIGRFVFSIIILLLLLLSSLSLLSYDISRIWWYPLLDRVECWFIGWEAKEGQLLTPTARWRFILMDVSPPGGSRRHATHHRWLNRRRPKSHSLHSVGKSQMVPPFSLFSISLSLSLFLCYYIFFS